VPNLPIAHPYVPIAHLLVPIAHLLVPIAQPVRPGVPGAMSTFPAVPGPSRRSSTARDDVLAALGAIAGKASPAELATASGRSPSSVTRVLSDLRSEGLVAGPRRGLLLTAAGRLASRRTVEAPVGRFEEAVEASFGASPLSAFCRLAGDLIVARRLFPGRDFHPALFAYGASGRGKTAVADLLARSLGLAREAILNVPALALGELVGRRSQIEGGFTFEAARHLALPFFCLDELGEADAPVRRRAQVLLHGDPVVHVEGDEVRIAGTVMATWNPRDGASVVTKPYFRRALTICVDDVHVPDLRARLAKTSADNAGRGTLAVEAYRAPRDTLDGDCMDILDHVYDVLTDEGKQRIERRVLELAALGRAARYKLDATADLRGIAYYVAVDVLTVTETVPGLVDPSWTVPLDQILQHLGEVPGMQDLADAARGRSEYRQALRDTIAKRRRQGLGEDLHLVEQRSALSARIAMAHDAIKNVPMTRRAEAAGLRAVLRQLRARVDNAKRIEALEDIGVLVTDPLDRARALRSDLDRAKLDTERERAQVAAQARNDRKERRLQERSAKEQATFERSRRVQLATEAAAQLAEVRNIAKDLEGLYRRARTRAGESPLDVLARIVLPGGHHVLRYENPPPAPDPRPDAALIERIRHRIAPPRPGTWHTIDPDVSFPGYEGSCRRLAAWGPDTRRVLVPALRAIYNVEDQLEIASGRKHRPGRLALPEAAPPLPQVEAGSHGVAPLASALYDIGPRR